MPWGFYACDEYLFPSIRFLKIISLFLISSESPVLEWFTESPVLEWFTRTGFSFFTKIRLFFDISLRLE